MNHKRRLIAQLWLVLPPVFLSAVVHMADPDVDGWQGLASYSVLWSVLFFGFLAAAFVIFCLVALVNSGRPAFLIAACLGSAFSGLLLAAFGSGATTKPGVVWTFVASSGLVFLVILTAVVPAVALGWPHSRARE